MVVHFVSFCCGFSFPLSRLHQKCPVLRLLGPEQRAFRDDQLEVRSTTVLKRMNSYESWSELLLAMLALVFTFGHFFWDDMKILHHLIPNRGIAGNGSTNSMRKVQLLEINANQVLASQIAKLSTPRASWHDKTQPSGAFRMK